MKTVHTAPMEVLSGKSNGAFAIEPYEAGWADEALALVYVREIAGAAPRLVLQAQISVDGVRWLNHSTSPLVIDQVGGYSLSLAHFGNWLRLAGEVSGGPADASPAFIVDLYWVLKG